MRFVYALALSALLSATPVLSAAAPPPADHDAHAEPHRTSVVGSSESDVYHVSDCQHARRIRSENLVRWSSQSAARAAGYRACRVCDPGT